MNGWCVFEVKYQKIEDNCVKKSPGKCNDRSHTVVTVNWDFFFWKVEFDQDRYGIEPWYSHFFLKTYQYGYQNTSIWRSIWRFWMFTQKPCRTSKVWVLIQNSTYFNFRCETRFLNFFRTQSWLHSFKASWLADLKKTQIGTLYDTLCFHLTQVISCALVVQILTVA